MSSVLSADEKVIQLRKKPKETFSKAKTLRVPFGEDPVKEFSIPVGNPKSVHGQFRHARLTNKGTLLVAHMDMGKVCEYDINGKELSCTGVPGVWGAEPLANGNMLTCGNGVVREITPRGDTAWMYAMKDIPDYTIASLQLAIRRPNGNTIINDWFNQWQGTPDTSNLQVQCIEVTSDKKIVWHCVPGLNHLIWGRLPPSSF